MFPIPFNFPFRKKDGSIVSLSKAIEDGGGSYTLPTASDTTKGGVKVGAGLTMDGETLKNTNPTPYTLPAASDETLGGVKVGDGLEIDENGVLSASGGGGALSYQDYTINDVVYTGENVLIKEMTFTELIGKSIVAITPLSNNAPVFWLSKKSIVGNYSQLDMPLTNSTIYIYGNVSIAIDTSKPFKFRVWYV